MWPKEQRHPSAEEASLALQRNPEGSTPKGLWSDEKFLAETGSPEFNAKWKQIAASDPSFGTAQHDFIKSTHFDPQMAMLGKSGIDLSKRGAAVQDAVWSTSVQFGGQTSLIKSALAGKELQRAYLSDSDMFRRRALCGVRETRALSDLLSPSYFIQAQIFPYNYQDVIVRGNATRINGLFLREYFSTADVPGASRRPLRWHER